MRVRLALSGRELVAQDVVPARTATHRHRGPASENRGMATPQHRVAH